MLVFLLKHEKQELLTRIAILSLFVYPLQVQRKSLNSHQI